MEKQKPYLTFSFPPPGARSLLFKKGAEKNAEIMRQKTVEEHREAQTALADMRLLPPGTRSEPEECDGVSCEWVLREGCPEDKLICYIHGGSWAFGNLKTSRPVAALLGEITGCGVLVVDYRLAPEHPFPAASDDCVAVYRWLLRRGLLPQNMAFFGDSAGGNLTLSLFHRLKMEGLPLPAAAGLASPATDMSETSALIRRMPDLLFTQHEGREQDVFSLYCGDHDRKAPLISPIYGDLTGFPPLLIHVGSDEELCIDCDLFASACHTAGVDVALKIWRDMFHDFSVVGVTLKESRESLKEFADFFREKLHLPPVKEK